MILGTVESVSSLAVCQTKPFVEVNSYVVVCNEVSLTALETVESEVDSMVTQRVWPVLTSCETTFTCETQISMIWGTVQMLNQYAKPPDVARCDMVEMKLIIWPG